MAEKSPPFDFGKLLGLDYKRILRLNSVIFKRTTMHVALG